MELAIDQPHMYVGSYHIAEKFGGRKPWQIYHDTILARERFGEFV